MPGKRTQAQFIRRRFTRRVALGAGLASLGGSALLADCGRTRTPVAAPSGSGGSGQPQAGGTLTLMTTTDDMPLDPAARTAVELLFTNNRLLGYQAGPDVKFTDLILQPELARRWETPDAQTFIFHLADNVTFAALPPVNGRALTSADVKWSYEYLSRTGALKNLPRAPSAAAFDGLDTIEIPDASTVRVHFSAPQAAFLEYAAMIWNPVLAHEIFDQDGDFKKRTIGSGPWQLDAQATNGSLQVLKKNPTYFVQGRPYVDQFNTLVLPDNATEQAAFLSKRADVLNYSGLDLATVERLQRALPTIVNYSYLDPKNHHVYLNVSRPPLNDERLRKAISLLIDRDAYIKVISEGKGEWSLAGGAPGLFTPEEIRQFLKYDPAQARQLVNAAGYADGLTLELIYPGMKYGDAYITAIQLLQAQVKQAGINLALTNIDPANETKRRQNGDFQLGMVPNTFQGNYDDYIYPWFHSGSARNYARVNDAKLDQLLDAQRQEVNPGRRRELLRQAVRSINEVPWALGLYWGEGYQFWQPRLKNYAPNMGVLTTPLTNSWLAR